MATKSIRKDVDSVIEQLYGADDLKFRAVASSEKIDRDGDSIPLDAWQWDEFSRNPCILLNHSRETPAIAKATKLWKDYNTRRLMVDIEFPKPGTFELSDAVRGLLKFGAMSCLSVGFMGKGTQPLKDEYGEYTGGRLYTDVELLEISIVNTPSNTDARLVEARNAGYITEKQLNMLKHPTPMQQEIDRLVSEEMLKRGLFGDDIQIEHWQIDEIAYDVRQRLQKNNPRPKKKKEEKDPGIIRMPMGYKPLNLRKNTMAEIKRRTEQQEAEKWKKRRWIG